MTCAAALDTHSQFGLSRNPMTAKVFSRAAVFTATVLTLALTGFLLSACTTSPVPPTSVPTAVATSAPKPEWFSIPLTDVRTGQTFTMNDFAGKVVLIQTIVQWCSSCAYQQHEVSMMKTLLGQRDDLISISLDVDLKEDAVSLKKYVDHFGFNWYFAVAPLEITRALGNLYSAEYLNAPLEPMLIIDRSGNVYGLPYGFKNANALSNTLGPYLK
jgi:cytochrome oxidase Cu insertion factor (SCO1/SenC/PrrC family)